jgi:hypothetical protein
MPRARGSDFMEESAIAPRSEPAPLSTLLSFAWTALTIEIDNLFEARMSHRTTWAGGRGVGPWLVSHAMWWTCMRFVDEKGLRLRELEALAGATTNLNGMARWGYINVEAGSRAKPGPDAFLRATPKGLRARETWAGLPEEVELRWSDRIGADRHIELRSALATLVDGLRPDLPDCLPILHYGLMTPRAHRVERTEMTLSAARPLVALLARALVAFTLDYEEAARLSLAIGANVLRVVDESGMRVRDLPEASGVAKPAIAMALGFLQRRKLAMTTAVGRVKIVGLTPKGLEAKHAYFSLVREIEARWQVRFGVAAVENLRRVLEQTVGGGAGARLIAEAITPPPAGWRARIKPAKTLPWQPMVLHRGGYPDGS